MNPAETGSTSLHDHFEAEHAAKVDPWGVDTRWYEIRKRAILLAALPLQTYESALEIGCSIGALTERLAERSEAVLALDFAATAVEKARERLAGSPHVTIEQGDIAERLPDGRWDLIVLSEVGYYLEPDTLDALALSLEARLLPGGSILACHWRHPEPDFQQSGDAVHAALVSHLSLPRLVHHDEPDFVLDVFGGPLRKAFP